MTKDKPTYKFGLYGRCPVCKEITKEVCEGCGAPDAFTDSSKPGIVVCTACNLEHSIKCSKGSCNGQVKVLRTPKNEDEQKRIDEYIYRKQHKEMDKRVYKVKESPKQTVVKEMRVPVDEVKKKDKKVIDLKSDIDMDLLDESKKDEIVSSYKSKKTGEDTSKNEPEKKSASKKEDKPEITEKPEPEKEKEDKPEITEKPEYDDKTVEGPGENNESISLEKEDKPAEKKKEDRELSSEEKQELDLIKDYWKKKEAAESEEKEEEERRIVNQFYDEQEDDVLDKKINFENIFNETAYYDCRVCGREENKIICEKCGQSDQFSLNYDALSCKCGNDIKVETCECGAKHGHSDFYLISEGIKWQYSKSKSYYNYRKGRMLVFSTCPTCGVFSVEKCKVCGSKVNFGMPNRNNEVYCKNCGSVNQFICENRNCNDTVKSLKNPNSIEQKLDWLNEVMNFKSRIADKKVKYSEPGSDKPKTKTAAASTASDNKEINLEESSLDFTNSFIEEFDNKTKDIITSSFINEVEDEVKQRKKLQDELRDYNKTHKTTKPSFGTPEDSGSGGGSDDEPNEEISFDDSGNGISYYIIIVVIVLAVIGGGLWAYLKFTSGDDTGNSIQEEVFSGEGSVNETYGEETRDDGISMTDEGSDNTSEEDADTDNAAQSYIDSQKENIEKSKDAVKKSNEAQQKALEEVDGLE